MDIRAIAARSGYGVGTVSRAINGQPNVSVQARERILAVMEECGYEPSSNAREVRAADAGLSVLGDLSRGLRRHVLLALLRAPGHDDPPGPRAPGRACRPDSPGHAGRRRGRRRGDSVILYGIFDRFYLYYDMLYLFLRYSAGISFLDNLKPILLIRPTEVFLGRVIFMLFKSSGNGFVRDSVKRYRFHITEIRIYRYACLCRL